MKQTSGKSKWRGTVFALSGWLLAACGVADRAPTAPMVAPSAAVAPSQSLVGDLGSTVSSTVGTLSAVTTLGRLSPLPIPLSSSAEIGPAGGTLTLGATGLRVIVPKGAVSTTVKFKVTALPGPSVAYEFEPHGIRFNVPLQFRQNMFFTLWNPGQSLEGGYFANPLQVDKLVKKAKVSEKLKVKIEGTDIRIDIWHFSGYLVSMA